jgi:hypothetical protein
MFAVLGVAGIFCIQQWAHREQVKQHTAAALKSALKAAGRTARLSSSSDRRSASSDSSRSSWQQLGRGLKDGCFVCFKDRTGQVAVIQPYGNGGTWQVRTSGINIYHFWSSLTWASPAAVMATAWQNLPHVCVNLPPQLPPDARMYFCVALLSVMLLQLAVTCASGGCCLLPEGGCFEI